VSFELKAILTHLSRHRRLLSLPGSERSDGVDGIIYKRWFAVFGNGLLYSGSYCL